MDGRTEMFSSFVIKILVFYKKGNEHFCGTWGWEESVEI